MNALAPSITQLSPSSRARVRVAPASDPASGSVSPNAASARPATRSGSQRSFCSLGAEGQDRVDAEPHAGRQRDADRLVDPAELLDGDAQAGEVARRTRRTPRERRGRTARARPSSARARRGSGAARPTPPRAARSRPARSRGRTRRKSSCSLDSSNAIVLIPRRIPCYLYVKVKPSGASEPWAQLDATGRRGMAERLGDGRTWTIAELAEEFGVTHRTIRFYEDRGLVTPERMGTRRVYHPRDRVRLALVLRGKRLGFDLAEIARDRRHVRPGTRRGGPAAVPAGADRATAGRAGAAPAGHRRDARRARGRGATVPGGARRGRRGGRRNAANLLAVPRSVLVLNAGSSSVKYRLLEPGDRRSARRGHEERVEGRRRRRRARS